MFNPPGERTNSGAKVALELFWGNGPDSLNFLAELTVQKRVLDPWYNNMLRQCREGTLESETYCFLLGLPTRHAGSWQDSEGALMCGQHACSQLPNLWHELRKDGNTWEEMLAKAPECGICSSERDRRNRLVSQDDLRLQHPQFLQAPYIHKHNEPKYHALLLRAVENAKRGSSQPNHILWVVAEDTVHNPKEFAGDSEQLQRKRARLLQYHDQKTAGLPGLLPLYPNIRMRVTEKISKKLCILKHTPCHVVRWDLRPADRLLGDGPERMLSYMPACIYVKFDNVDWRVHPQLPVGVFPLKAVKRDWEINKATGSKATRRGFQLVPDYSSTAHLARPSTLHGIQLDMYVERKCARRKRHFSIGRFLPRGGAKESKLYLDEDHSESLD